MFVKNIFKINICISLIFKCYLYALNNILFIGKSRESDQPQIFILGLPRSGTTLIYQYLVHRLNVAYFTNGVGKYYKTPCAITYIQKKAGREYKSNFNSHYGKTDGNVSPREAGSFWGVFFGFSNYKEYKDIDPGKLKKLRRIINCIQNIFGKAPFVNKNVKHMLRLDVLEKVFEHSIFIVIERNISDVALSVLRARNKLLEDPNEWWSVKPLNYYELKDLKKNEQIYYQLKYLNQKLDNDLLNIPEQRKIKISYEDFCRDPEIIIRHLSSIVELKKFKNTPVSSFKISKPEPKTQEEKELLRMFKTETPLCP